MPTRTHSRIDQEDVVSEERSDPGSAERREVFAGLPGGPGLDEEPLEVSDELLDALLSGARTAEEIAGPDGLLGQLTRRLLNRALEAELTEHLGYEAGEAPPGGAGNARNGKPGKTILTDQGPLRIRSPRDRTGTFEPQIVRKRQTRWVGFDDRVISLYARGLTVREIQGHLAEIYGTEVSPDLISKVTDTVLADAKAWQNRPLEARLPDRLPRCAGREDPRRAHGQEPSVLRRAGRQPRRRTRRARPVVPADRGREVLAARPHRPEDPLGDLHPVRLRRRAHRLPGRRSKRRSRTRLSKPAWCTRFAPACGSCPTRTGKPLAADLRKIRTLPSTPSTPPDELQAFAEKWDHRYPMI